MVFGTYYSQFKSENLQAENDFQIWTLKAADWLIDLQWITGLGAVSGVAMAALGFDSTKSLLLSAFATGGFFLFRHFAPRYEQAAEDMLVHFRQVTADRKNDPQPMYLVAHPGELDEMRRNAALLLSQHRG